MVPVFQKILIFCLLALCNLVEAQSKKEVVKNEIKSATVKETKTGKAAVPVSYKKFDVSGNTIEKGEYNNEGGIKRKETFEYNGAGLEISQSIFKGNGSLKKKIIKKYSALGGTGNEIAEELEYDENGKLAGKRVFIYNDKGLKAEKKEFDGGGKLLSITKYEYEKR
mgnify:CR=1 FL=1